MTTGFLSFVGVSTGLNFASHKAQKRGLTASYDAVSQRFSMIAEFAGNLKFEVSWEYGYHFGATRLSAEHLSMLEAHSDELLGLISPQSSSSSSATAKS